MAKILVAGLNPAWQLVFSLPAYQPGGVNRAADFRGIGSGKGLNAAKTLARLGHDVSLLQIVAGENGKRVLAACETFGVRSLEAWTAGETRTCVTLLRGGEVDEIIAPFSVSDDTLPGKLLDGIRGGAGWDALLVCGSAPPGIPDSLHSEIGALANVPVVIWDSVFGLTPEILSRVSWLKVNASEHQSLAPMLEASSAHPSFLITDGAAPAMLRDSSGAWKCTVPRLDAVVNPIGAGDTATALLADGLLRGLDARGAAAHALSAASASCLNPLPSEFDPADAERIAKSIRWTEANGGQELKGMVAKGNKGRKERKDHEGVTP
jgi:fructose-1-phosphate kinase PfkB-like protein